VGLNRRDGKVRNVAVSERRLRLDFLDKAAEAGTEDDANSRPAGPLGPDCLSGLLNLVKEFRHDIGSNNLGFPGRSYTTGSGPGLE